MKVTSVLVILFFISLFLGIMFLFLERAVEQRNDPNYHRIRMVNSARDEGATLSTNIQPTMEAFQNASDGTIVLYDHWSAGWESGGKYILIISVDLDQKIVTGVDPNGEIQTIETSRVKCLYDPDRAPQNEYKWTSQTYLSLLVMRAREKQE